MNENGMRMRKELEYIYDDAAKSYKLAIQNRNRHDAKIWLERMKFSDIRLAERGES